MAADWTTVRTLLFAVGWPTLFLASVGIWWDAHRFSRSLPRGSAGSLVVASVLGWIGTSVCLTAVATFFMLDNPDVAVPTFLPFFFVWAGTIAVMVFVTRRWNDQAWDLRKYYAEIERMDRAKTQLIDQVSHAINTPLTPLSLQLASLRSGKLGPLNERQEKAVQMMGRSVDRLSVLVGQVILASQVQTGAVVLHTVRFSLTDLARRVAGARGEDAGAASVEVDAPSEVMAVADPHRTEFVVAALVDHARIASTPRRPVLLACQEAGDGPRLVVRFEPHESTDPGRLFDPIPHRAAGADGTFDLSLFIAEGLARAMGGRLSARERQGELVVTLELPSEARLEDGAVRAPDQRSVA